MTNLTFSPADGNCLGNGSGSILYGSAAIDLALTVFSDIIRVVSWKESI